MQSWLKGVTDFFCKISVSIEEPYIDFSFVKATPAVVLCIAYVTVLVIVCCYEIKK